MLQQGGGDTRAGGAGAQAAPNPCARQAVHPLSIDVTTKGRLAPEEKVLDPAVGAGGARKGLSVHYFWGP